jgi:hypothetical protein
MTAVYSPRVGDYFVQRTASWQAQCIRWGTSSRWNHAGIVIRVDADGVAWTLEAQPKGAVVRQMPNRGVLAVRPSLDDIQRGRVAIAGPTWEGTGYNWDGLAALGLATYGATHVPVVGTWVEGQLRDERQQFCSQIVDVVLRDAGFHLFADGRPPGLVAPGDLEFVAIMRGWGLFPLDGETVVRP